MQPPHAESFTLLHAILLQQILLPILDSFLVLDESALDVVESDHFQRVRWRVEELLVATLKWREAEAVGQEGEAHNKDRNEDGGAPRFREFARSSGEAGNNKQSGRGRHPSSAGALERHAESALSDLRLLASPACRPYSSWGGEPRPASPGFSASAEGRFAHPC